MVSARGWGALRAAALLVLALGLAMPPLTGRAQDTEVVRSPVLTVDPDALFANSMFGQAFEERLAADTSALEAENRRLEKELAAEEQELTDKRPELDPERFRELADTFDSKVQRIRKQQQAKARELGSRADDARRRFFSAAAPVLQSIMQEAGAAVIVDKRSVFMSANIVDVTQLAIERVDAVIGKGADLPDAPANDTAPGDSPGDATPETPRTDGAVRLPPADAVPEDARP